MPATAAKKLTPLLAVLLVLLMEISEAAPDSERDLTKSPVRLNCPVVVSTSVVTVPVNVGLAKLALSASLPLSFCIACNIESVAATVPAPEVYPVKTFAITGALVSVVATPTEVTSPVRFGMVVGAAVTADTTLVALLYTNVDVPAATATPVPVEFFTVIASAQALFIR